LAFCMAREECKGGFSRPCATERHHASLTSKHSPFIIYSLHVMTKPFSTIYSEKKANLIDRPETKINNLIRLLTFTTDQEKTNKIIKEIQYYQNLVHKINNDEKQSSLFD